MFLQHFRGGMDNWDPLVTDGLAAGRPVILFNYAGVASSTGENATTVDGMADHVAVFLKALGLTIVDVLGFSIGGFVAQSFADRYPELVRRLVLAGTGPRNGDQNPDPRIFQVAANPVPTVNDFLFLFFSPSEASPGSGPRLLGTPARASGPRSAVLARGHASTDGSDRRMDPATWRALRLS